MDLLRIVNKTKSNEGYREHPYRDSLGVWTVGYGTTWVFNEYGKVTKIAGTSTKMTREIAEYHLYAHISQAVRQASHFVRNFDRLHAAQQEALVDMAYQLGSRQNQFKKAKKAIEHGNNDSAYRELINSRWANQTRRRAIDVAETFLQHEIIL